MDDSIPRRETSGERRTDFSMVGRMDDARSFSVTEVSMKSWSAFWGKDQLKFYENSLGSQLDGEKQVFLT